MLKSDYLMRMGRHYGIFPTLWDFVDWIKLRNITADQIKEIEYMKVPENEIQFGLPDHVVGFKWKPAEGLLEDLYHYKHMSGFSTTFSLNVRGARREIELYQFYVMYLKSELPNSGPVESFKQLKEADAIHCNPGATSFVYWLNP